MSRWSAHGLVSGCFAEFLDGVGSGKGWETLEHGSGRPVDQLKAEPVRPPFLADVAEVPFAPRRLDDDTDATATGRLDTMGNSGTGQ